MSVKPTFSFAADVIDIAEQVTDELCLLSQLVAELGDPLVGQAQVILECTDVRLQFRLLRQQGLPYPSH